MTTATINQAAHNATLLQEGYDAFQHADMAGLAALFSPDAVWHVQRLGQLSGDHVGFPAILAFLGRTMELTQGTFRAEPIEILANDAGVAAVVRSRGQRDGITLDDRQIQHFHLQDDKVVEVWQFVGNPEATERFWR